MDLLTIKYTYMHPLITLLRLNAYVCTKKQIMITDFGLAKLFKNVQDGHVSTHTKQNKPFNAVCYAYNSYGFLRIPL